MNVESLKLVFFSPTGSTRSVAQAIADGVGQYRTEPTDITRPDVRKPGMQTSRDELLIIAVPVYMGRVPALLGEWLHALEADSTPAVCVVVYGNRDYEDALLELKDVVSERGAVPIACAAFIGEHSFSSSDTPIAVARPDAADLRRARVFGRQVGEKLRSTPSPTDLADVATPGNHPYRDLPALFSVDFIDVGDACMQCGVCAESCPVGAIDRGDSSARDKERCILCCACIKRCPEGARTMKAGMIKDIAERLSRTCRDRNEPAFFL